MKIEITCDLCGKTFLRERSEVNRNKKLNRENYCNRSCQGRASIFDKIPEEKRHNVEHLKDYRKKKDEHSQFRWHLRNIRRRQLIKSINFDLTLEDLKSQWDTQNGLCAYTKLPMTPRFHNLGEKKSIYSASVDRIDSTKGYTRDNIQFVCCAINLAKVDFTDEQMREFILNIRNCNAVELTR